MSIMVYQRFPPLWLPLRLCISRLVEVFYYYLQRRTDRGFQPLRAVHR